MKGYGRLFTERDVEILLEHAYREGSDGVILDESHYAYRESTFGNGPRGATLLADYDVSEAHLANGKLDFRKDERALLLAEEIAQWRDEHPGLITRLPDGQ